MTKDYSAHFDSEAEIAELAEGMIACVLPKEKWTHAAHFATAAWIIRRRPDLDAARDMPRLIAAYNESRGGRNTDTEGYHETITQASVRATRAFLDGLSSSVPLHEAVNAMLLTPLGRPDWILAYWSKDLLFSVGARRGWVEPNLQPLPF
ncbi:hypothetical protein [Phenylobacterium montanum]|uniref:Uncharacterized protein n=1 Tax=Phenylobacterium montanum TaxID=2823693 RepID=A0A975FXM7_9CAUL|nr:hypothetical protein [Caulobacter sp. S6]QUD86723.1 hypothetical protein KCG34_16785 [Caulobacter sp. S6]